ncbi:MAG: ABC transporter ATP-binding protein [Candidatus Thorarchaeota archaeon]
MVQVTNVTKTYMMGEIPVNALRGVTLSVQRGDYLSILGPSGSGKSTLLNLIGALDRPTSGIVEVNGVELGLLSDNQLAEIRGQIGFVFQFFNLIPRLDAIGNVELPLTIAGVPKKERRKRAEEMLVTVGLDGRFEHKPSELSGGERQRVAIARALITDPSFVLMDEPTGNLDSKTAADVMDLVTELNESKGITVIVVTHDPEVGRRAHRSVRMRDGLIVSEELN